MKLIRVFVPMATVPSLRQQPLLLFFTEHVPTIWNRTNSCVNLTPSLFFTMFCLSLSLYLFLDPFHTKYALCCLRRTSLLLLLACTRWNTLGFIEVAISFVFDGTHTNWTTIINCVSFSFYRISRYPKWRENENSERPNIFIEYRIFISALFTICVSYCAANFI